MFFPTFKYCNHVYVSHMLTNPLVNYYIPKIKLQLLQPKLRTVWGPFSISTLLQLSLSGLQIEQNWKRGGWSPYNLLDWCLISERQTANLCESQSPAVSAEWLLKLRCCLGAVCGMEWFAYAALGIFTAILSFLMDLSVTKLLRGTRTSSL